jgi:hypothetical protein
MRLLTAHKILIWAALALALLLVAWQVRQYQLTGSRAALAMAGLGGAVAVALVVYLVVVVKRYARRLP